LKVAAVCCYPLTCFGQHSHPQGDHLNC